MTRSDTGNSSSCISNSSNSSSNSSINSSSNSNSSNSFSSDSRSDNIDNDRVEIRKIVKNVQKGYIIWHIPLLYDRVTSVSLSLEKATATITAEIDYNERRKRREGYTFCGLVKEEEDNRQLGERLIHATLLHVRSNRISAIQISMDGSRGNDRLEKSINIHAYVHQEER
ncbi:putative uncharacterized protein DDB_G0268364 [Pogonomyrmex barbatus]|uniref:Uncharacterized protein n=1 Tax=Pogonomyrmex barbatus TaxID=144034 RepID=A0A8N1SBI9_9HYME|nr:putative uncharacterized protein DDB_G0268364 [Pogonomyrmex barbatus]